MEPLSSAQGPRCSWTGRGCCWTSSARSTKLVHRALEGHFADGLHREFRPQIVAVDNAEFLHRVGGGAVSPPGAHLLLRVPHPVGQNLLAIFNEQLVRAAHIVPPPVGFPQHTTFRAGTQTRRFLTPVWKIPLFYGILYGKGESPTGVYTMKETPARPLPHIGLRNLKTALSASLCALIYFFLNRNPAFACIGAIFGMGADMDHSKLHGGNRLFGTVIGGFLGIGLYRIYLVFYPDGDTTCCWCPCSSAVSSSSFCWPRSSGSARYSPAGGALPAAVLHRPGRLHLLLSQPHAGHRRGGGHVPAHQRSAPRSGWTPGRKARPCGTGARRAAEGSGPYDTGSFRP